MKKFWTLILALSIVLSLCACGNSTPVEEPFNGSFLTTVIPSDDMPTPTQTDNTEPAEPTEEERQILTDYCRFEYLLRYSHGTMTDQNVYSNEKEEWIPSTEAVDYVCKKMLEMDMSVVKKFWDTEVMEEIDEYDAENTMDCDSVLARIKSVEGLIYSETTDEDKLGNSITGVDYVMYDANGVPEERDQLIIWELLEAKPFDLAYRYDMKHLTEECEYDGDRITKIKYVADGEVVYLVTPTYDANGLRIQDFEVGLEEETQTLYTYDQQNRVVRVCWVHDNYEYALDFTYDDQGRYAGVTHTYYGLHDHRGGDFNDIHIQKTVTYTYGENGNVIAAEYVLTNMVENIKIDTYTMEYDEQGRLHLTTIAYGHLYDTITGSIREEANPVIRVVENIYGTCYYYANEGL